MDNTKILGIIVALLIILLLFQTFQLINIQNKLSESLVSREVPATGAIVTTQTPTQLPAQRGGC